MDRPLVEGVTNVVEDVSGTRVYRRSATGGGNTRTLRDGGIPTVEFGVGTDTVHGTDEFTTDALVTIAQIYARLPYVLIVQQDR